METKVQAFRPTSHTAQAEQFIKNSGVTMMEVSKHLKEQTKISSQLLEENGGLRRREQFFKVATKAARLGIIKQSSIVDWVEEHWTGQRPPEVWEEILTNQQSFNTIEKQSSAKPKMKPRAKAKDGIEKARGAFFES